MTPKDPSACCGVAHGCIFAKALLARSASCECAERRQAGETSTVACLSPVAHHNCETLAALFAERARFALKLPPAGRPMLHVQALRLQCGGVAALREHMGTHMGVHGGEKIGDHIVDPVGDRAGPGSDAATDVHRLVQAAQQRHQSLTELPWAELVPRMRAWAPRRRGAPPR